MRRVDLSNFNLNLLLALDGLLSQRSVTAAAKRVRVTPSAMSHSLSEPRHLLATLLMPALLEAAAREAPGTSLEIVPSSRRGNAWLLETGDVDLALGAIVDLAPGIRRVDLLTDGFACAARKGHPGIEGALDLD